MSTSRRPIRLAAAGILLALGCASCGSSPTKAASQHPSNGACDTGTTKTALIPVSQRSPAGTSGAAPTVVVPRATPPKVLECADLIYGSGATVKSGSSVSVQYVLATYSTHRVIQSSWTSEPLPIVVDDPSEPLIPGWEVGMIGMQVGGRRELIIPPSLGYRDRSPGAGIAKNDTLVFVIDVLSSTGG